MKASRAKIRLSVAEELENVTVVNRHTYSGPQDNSYIYIGRGTPLGNQWSHVSGTNAAYKANTRDEAVSKFHDWLSSQIRQASGAAFEAIQQIKERVAAGEEIKLACSCVPQLCHGDVIKGSVELLIHNDRYPEQTLKLEPLRLPPPQPTLPRPTETVPAIERISPAASSGRAVQAHAEVIATGSITDDLHTLYNVPEGTTRPEHASHLNSIDQFAREAFERGATLTETVLSIPKDPDARPRDDTKVTIGTEAHAINFVRGFIADPLVAAEKGRLVFELGNKAAGQWMDSHGRLTIFDHIYTEIRQDPSGTYRSNEEKAACIDKVLEQTRLWAQELPEPTPEPTPEEVHEYTLALAEENHTLAVGQIQLLGEPTEIQTPELEHEPSSFYLDHLQSATHGLATIGELSGFSDLQFNPTPEDHDLTNDENQLYADMYELAISDTPELITPEGDHLGAEREVTTSVVLDATFDRINLGSLPPPLPELSIETETQLFDHILPSIDAQLESGVTKREILSPLYAANRETEQRNFESRVNEIFLRANPNESNDRTLSRSEELNAISSLRILVRAEYDHQTKPFTREAIQWAKDNYRTNPDLLRSQGKLQKGEYQALVTSQSDARITWLNSHPGQQAPTRAEIASINRLERSGHQLNAAIAGINPTKEEHTQTLDLIQSRLASATSTVQTLLQNYEAAERVSQQLTTDAIYYANDIRSSQQFQELKAELHNQLHEDSLDQRQALIRANNPRLNASTQTLAQHSSSYPELTGQPRPLTAYAKLSIDNQVAERDVRKTLSDMLISPEIEKAQNINNAQLASYNELCNHITGQTITTSSQAREALTSKLQGLERASSMVEGTRARFGLQEKPTISLNLATTPIYVSLTSCPNVRIPVESQHEHNLILATAQQCRLDTSTWSSLYSPHHISGVDPEREALTQFASNYIDFRLKDHSTQELSRNPLFRSYTEKLSAARNPKELLKTCADIKLENYERHQQSIAHRADPVNTAAPDRQPLTVMEMREAFLSTTPTAAASRTEHDEMRDILQSMSVFGNEKTERVRLLARGKIEPSPTLSKLLANLETRQTVRAVNHFYSSLRTPPTELKTQNRFDIRAAHVRLPQYERDYLHNHALAQKYEAVNNKEREPQHTHVPTAASTTLEHNEPATSPTKTPFYREYYGRADWLEAQQVVSATANLKRGAISNLDRTTIVPELKDVEVQAINYVVNTFDQNRQAQIADQLKNSPDQHQQAIGNMITIASEVKLAASGPDIKEIELQLPISYTLSPDSVTSIISYTQQEAERAIDAARLPTSELSELRQEAQAQAWRDMEREVIRDPASILDAPAEALYQAQDLTHGIAHTASLQERARTAFRTLNAHTTACINKTERAVALEQSRTHPFRAPEEQQTTRELTKAALDPSFQQSKASLIKQHAKEYALIQQNLTPTDRERATQLKDYAASSRADYLHTFSSLDRSRQYLNAQETRGIETRSTDLARTTLDRYTAARSEITRATLGEKIQEMVLAKSPPEISREQATTLTLKDLLPASVHDAAFDQAREPAWQSLEPQELRNLAAGREVPDSLVTLADEVMDRVATAQTIELELDDAREELSTFISDRLALVEAPIKDERATLAYHEQFRETLTAIANDNTQDPDRREAATHLLETLDRAELDSATLVNQATNQQLDPIPATLTIEANAAAIAHARDSRQLPVFSIAERENIQQQVIAELPKPANEHYNQLRLNVEKVQERFQSSVQAVDDKLTELDLSRIHVNNEVRLQEFQEISRPAAIEINSYIKDTVHEEGLAAILDPTRFEEHVERVTNVIIETARNNGLTLATSSENHNEITQIASNLFDKLASGIERANADREIAHQFTHQRDTATLNQQSLNEITNIAPIVGVDNQAAHGSLDLPERQRPETDRLKDGSSSNLLQDHSGKEPTAQEVSKTQDLTIQPSAQTNATAQERNTHTIGGSMEDAAHVMEI
jgi:uncharacterized protein DUF4326